MEEPSAVQEQQDGATPATAKDRILGFMTGFGPHCIAVFVFCQIGWLTIKYDSPFDYVITIVWAGIIIEAAIEITVSIMEFMSDFFDSIFDLPRPAELILEIATIGYVGYQAIDLAKGWSSVASAEGNPGEALISWTFATITILANAPRLFAEWREHVEEQQQEAEKLARKKAARKARRDKKRQEQLAEKAEHPE